VSKINSTYFLRHRALAAFVVDIVKELVEKFIEEFIHYRSQGLWLNGTSVR
jgi:hypothetical protein